MDWEFWGAIGGFVGGVAAVLALTYTIYKDWPEIKHRKIVRIIVRATFGVTIGTILALGIIFTNLFFDFYSEIEQITSLIFSRTDAPNIITPMPSPPDSQIRIGSGNIYYLYILAGIGVLGGGFLGGTIGTIVGMFGSSVKKVSSENDVFAGAVLGAIAGTMLGAMGGGSGSLVGFMISEYIGGVIGCLIGLCIGGIIGGVIVSRIGKKENGAGF